MYWTDNSVSLERVMEMKRFQVNTPMQRLPSQKSSGGRVRRGLLVEQRVAEGNSSVTAVSQLVPVPLLCISCRGCRFTSLYFCCVSEGAIGNTLAVV